MEILKTKWTIDPAHSEIFFKVKHLMITNVKGEFRTFEATVISEGNDFSNAEVNVEIDASSIFTNSDARDGHLKSPDFFEVEKYPSMTFKSTSITVVSKDKYKLNGNLTLRGITKPVSMDLLYRGTNVDVKSNKSTSGFQLTGMIKRSDFGVGPKFPAPVLSDEVQIKADGEFVKN